MMSFALTTDQVRRRQKTVTRRNGWRFARVGMIVQPVIKCQGIPKGGRVEKIGGPIRFTDVRREPLRDPANDSDRRYGAAEAALEGFPEFGTWQRFVDLYVDHNGGVDGQIVTRIEFEYIE